MKCECGHYLAANTDTEMVCRCGKTYTVVPELKSPLSLGGIFIERFEKFRERLDCGCRDAAAFMNRWGVERSRDRIEMLVQLTFAKTVHVSKDDIRNAILESIDQYEEQQRGIIA